MLSQIKTRIAVGAIVIAVCVLVSACEDNHKHSSDSGINVAESQTSSINKRNPERAQQSSEARQGQEENPNGAVMVIESGYQDNFMFHSNEAIFVFAGSYLTSNGMYEVNGQLFTSCDELGFYLLTTDPVGEVVLMDCGTEAFP